MSKRHKVKFEGQICVPTGHRNETGFAAALRAMDIGDSFTVALNNKKNQIGNISTSAKRNGVKVVCRTLKDEGVIRLWRIK